MQGIQCNGTEIKKITNTDKQCQGGFESNQYGPKNVFTSNSVSQFLSTYTKAQTHKYTKCLKFWQINAAMLNKNIPPQLALYLLTHVSIFCPFISLICFSSLHSATPATYHETWMRRLHRTFLNANCSQVHLCQDVWLSVFFYLHRWQKLAMWRMWRDCLATPSGKQWPSSSQTTLLEPSPVIQVFSVLTSFLTFPT